MGIYGSQIDNNDIFDILKNNVQFDKVHSDDDYNHNL